MGILLAGVVYDVSALTTSYQNIVHTIGAYVIPSGVTKLWVGIKNHENLDLYGTTNNVVIGHDAGDVYSGGQAGGAHRLASVGWPSSWSDGEYLNAPYDLDASLTITSILYAASGTYSSEVFDAGSNVTFSAFTGNIYMPSGSVEYWARADTSVFLKDAASPAWTDLGAGTNGMKNFILASLAAFQTKRYVQLRAVISAPSGQKTTPELDWMAVGYQGGTYISSLAEAVVRDGRYLCTCKTTDAAVNDTILVLDKNSAWTILKDLAVSSLHEHNLVLYGGKCFGDAPAAPVITNGGTPGSTTYGYKIVVHYSTGGTTALSAEGTTVTGNATLSGTNYNIITWSAVTGAASYKVYRTTGGATQGLIATITAGTETTNDTGIVATGGAPALSSLINADDSTATDDSGVDFDAYAITKALDLGYPEIRKDFRRIFVQHRDRSMSRTAYGRVQWSRDLGYLTGDEAWQDMSTGYALTPVSALGVTTTEIPQVDTAKGWLMSYRLGKTSDFDNPVEFQGLIVHALIREVGKKGKPTPTDPGEVFPLN
jgi:hypothetical protein